MPGLYRRFFGAGAFRPDVEFRPVWWWWGEAPTNNDSCKHLTRQCTRLNASSQFHLKRRTPHTLPRWPRTRRTTTTIAVITTVITIAATATAATTTSSSLWWFSSASGLTRRLRLRNLDALRRWWRRVWMFDCSWLFAFLPFSLNCLRHTKLFRREGWRKGEEEIKERTRAWEC